MDDLEKAQEGRVVSEEVATMLLTLLTSVQFTVTAATIESQAALIARAVRELGG